MEAAFLEDTGLDVFFARLARTATNHVCGSNESAEKVRTVVDTVVKYRRSTSAMLGAGLLGAAVGGVAVDAAHAPEVRAAIGGAVGNVGNAVGNVTGKAVGFVVGVAHRCRGKLSRFNPYKKPEAAAQLPNLVPIPLMPPHAIELRVDMLPLTPDLQVLVESFHAECVRNHHFPLEEWKRAIQAAPLVEESWCNVLPHEDLLQHCLQRRLPVEKYMHASTLMIILKAYDLIMHRHVWHA